MLPVLFGENLFDELFDDAFRPMWDMDRALYGKHARAVMKTDVRETDSGYELDIDLPGFKKDEVKLDLKDGYLTGPGREGQAGPLHPAGALRRPVQPQLLCGRQHPARRRPRQV